LSAERTGLASKLTEGFDSGNTIILLDFVRCVIILSLCVGSRLVGLLDAVPVISDV
jgi:hypothetical protein